MNDPIYNTIITQQFDEYDPIKYLKIKIQNDRENLEHLKKHMSELDIERELNKLLRLEAQLAKMVVCRFNQMMNEKINGKEAPEQQDKLHEFLSWDKKPTIECLNFLLQEFFSNSYPGKVWKDDFITELVFEVTRTINFLNSASK